MYRITYKRSAVKALAKMPKATAERFRVAFSAIAINEIAHLDIKKMEGEAGFRLRIGRYRAVYEIDNGQLMVMVFNIGSRGDVYK